MLRLLSVLVVLLLSACRQDPAGTADPAARAAPNRAPAPASVPRPDAASPSTERAAPPTLRPVALGGFEPGNPLAEAMTGAIEIEDTVITGANGARFETERVAIVRGGDEFTAGQRYADVMMMDADQPVELRRVVDETAPSAQGGKTLCSGMKTGYLALASYDEGEFTLVKVIGLQGDGLPAANARDTSLCMSTFYLAKR